MTQAPSPLPTVTRVYQSRLMDSTRWNDFNVRDGDVVISTAYKAGTTWMQTIVGNLIFAGREIETPILQISPWLDMRLFPYQETVDILEAQTHRRFIKTHLPLDGLAYFDNVNYIFVARDPRDVFMSLWNHHGNHTDEFFEVVNGLPGGVGAALPPCPDDIHEFWRNWISRGSFEWENDGYPYWSFFHHAQTWWDYRHLPNIHFAHYNDLLADLNGGMRAVARFLNLEIDEELWPALVDSATFSTVKKNPDKVVSDQAKAIFKDGAHSFIHKGTNGRWKDVLTEAELAQYEDVKSRAVTPDCAHWLETGGPISS